MDGTRFVNTIKQILNDVPDAKGNYQGDYWQLYEIKNALNLSQYIFLQYIIATKQYHLVNSLVSQTPYNNSGDNYFTQPGSPKLLYPLRAVVGATDTRLKPARIYWGDGISHLDGGEAACFIVNQFLLYTERDPTTGRSVASGGRLTFLKYPTRIYIQGDPSEAPGDPTQDFPDEIYNQYIVPYACVVLGLKEITNQRDFKIWKNYIKSVLTVPDSFANFVTRYEFTGVAVRPGRPPSQEISDDNGL